MEKLLKYINMALIALIVGLSIFAYFKQQQYNRQIRELQNVIAVNDQTIEVQKDLYTKRTQELDDVKGLLGKLTEAEKRLQAELKKAKAQILSLTETNIKLKKALEASGGGTQAEVPGEAGQPPRLQVNFEHDFGFVAVRGFTLTNPPEYKLSLGNGSRPLKLTTIVSQQPDGTWRTYVQSSDENFDIDIGVSAVNPHITDPKWYERLKVHGDLGVGNGVLGGLGLAYQFGSVDIGGSVWGVTSGGGSVFYGLNFSWAPFKSSK